MKNITPTTFVLLLIVTISCNKGKEEAKAPVASFTYEVDELKVTLANTSQNTYTEATWDYGDGTSGIELIHTYAKDSTYTVKLTVKSEVGEDNAEEDIIVAELLDLINVSTDFGAFTFWLYDSTELHKANFLALAEEDFFDSTTFHRIVNGFVIQGGDPNTKDNDPNNDGSGGPGYEIDAEFHDSLTHVYGAVGAAREEDDVNPEKKSNGSQFYVVENINGAHGLDGNYTVFGIVLDGMETVETIAAQPNSGTPNNRPDDPIPMNVSIVQYTRAQLKSQFNFEPK